MFVICSTFFNFANPLGYFGVRVRRDFAIQAAPTAPDATCSGKQHHNLDRSLSSAESVSPNPCTKFCSSAWSSKILSKIYIYADPKAYLWDFHMPHCHSTFFRYCWSTLMVLINLQWKLQLGIFSEVILIAVQVNHIVCHWRTNKGVSRVPLQTKKAPPLLLQYLIS